MQPEPRPESVSLLPRHLLFGIVFDNEGPDHARFRRHGFPEHYIVHFTTSGGGIYGVSGGTFRVGPGDIVLNFPGSLHDWKTDPQHGSWGAYCAFFKARPHWGPWMQWTEIAPGTMHRRLDPRARQKLERSLARIDRLAKNQRYPGVLLAMAEFEKVLIGLHSAGSLPAAQDGQLTRLLFYISHNLSGDLSIARLTRETAIPRNALFKLFRDHMGMSPIHYIDQQRIQLAAELLRNKQMPIKAVAAAVGYSSPMYFSSSFKARMGVNPRLYRRRWI